MSPINLTLIFLSSKSTYLFLFLSYSESQDMISGVTHVHSIILIAGQCFLLETLLCRPYVTPMLLCLCYWMTNVVFLLQSPQLVQTESCQATRSSEEWYTSVQQGKCTYSCIIKLARENFKLTLLLSIVFYSLNITSRLSF